MRDPAEGQPSEPVAGKAETNADLPDGALPKVAEPGTLPAAPWLSKGDGPKDEHVQPKQVAGAVKNEPRWRDKVLWFWPAGAVATMAGAGHLFGAFGALLAAVVVAATLVLVIGDEAISLRTRIWVTALAVVMAAGVVVGREAGVGILAPSGLAEPPDLRGQVVSAEDIKGRNLRDALLAGAILDGLDLHRHDLTHVQAQGASFRRTILSDAVLVEADLRGADFTDACLRRANLTGAVLGGVQATGADVRDVLVVKENVASAAAWPQAGVPPPQHCR